MKRVVLFSMVITGIAGCAKTYPWEGIVYPKTGTLPYNLEIGRFSTLEECRAASLAVLSKTIPEEGASPDYECGLNCRVDASFSPPPGLLPMRICDETSK